MINYRDTHNFTPEELERLFLSVEWSSGHFPDKLVQAMKGFKTVFSAYDGDTLVGMICVMDDGVMNAYVHYLLVDPAYQVCVFSSDGMLICPMFRYPYFWT